MLSKKMTFSLMSLITLLAFAFAVTPAMAENIGIRLSYDEAENVDGRHIDVTLEFSEAMALSDIQAAMITVTVVYEDFTTVTGILTGQNEDGEDHLPDNPAMVADAAVMTTLNEEGLTQVSQKDIDSSTAGGQYDGRTFTFRIIGNNDPDDTTTVTVIPRAGIFADVEETDIDESIGATRVYVSVPAGIPGLDPAHAHTTGAEPLHDLGPSPSVLDIPLRTVVTDDDLDRDTPQVVSIQRLRPGSQTVVAAFQEAAVTGPFQVRIVLSEAPGVDFNPEIIVANATKSGYVVGTPFARHGGMYGEDDDSDPPAYMMDDPIPGQTIRPHPIEGRYNHDGVITATLGDAGTVGTDEYIPLQDVPEGLDEAHVPLPTGPTGLYWECRVTISPHRRAETVTISIDEFHDGDAPRNYYYPHQVDRKPNGRERLHLPVALEQFNLDDGRAVYLPHAEAAKITYANSTPGHYILATNKAGSHIKYYYHEGAPTAPRENLPLEQTPAELLYNVRASTALPNLESFLINNGTIHLVSYETDRSFGDAYISEIMWGTDASQDPVRNSNWIEIRNGTGAAIAVGDRQWALWFYEAHETPPTAYPADSYYEAPIDGKAGTIIDVVGTKASDTGLSWSIAGKGQSGRTNIDIARELQHVLTPTTPLISMYRKMVADTTVGAAAGAMMPGDGTMASNWVKTDPPSVNVGGPEIATNLGFRRENAIVATPGASPFDTPDEVKATEDKEAADTKAAADAITNTGTMPQAGSIYISEVMFAGGGVLPQWIEISNGSRTEEVNLSGWTITVANAVADADVSVGATATFTIPDGTTVAMSGQDDDPSTILVVTEKGRNSLTGLLASGQVINLAEDNEVELILAGVVTGKYTLLSDMAFEIMLAPPEPDPTKPPAGETKGAKAIRTAAEKQAKAKRIKATDMAGNLGADGAAAWALPMSEDGRSSIIRRHIQVTRGPAEPEDGTMMENWVLASDTSFAQVTHIRAQSYYGAASDVGTPGFRAGGALPVELSHFSPARDKVTGAVVITWSTQSELNNAGFFIKRSQQRDGEFKVINATMVQGAGTTSEKQFYTYNDTTAQPNVVYYYQIEDVSLDGNRQTLTRGIRLRGHVSVAGKLTTLWGDLKTSQ